MASSSLDYETSALRPSRRLGYRQWAVLGVAGVALSLYVYLQFFAILGATGKQTHPDWVGRSRPLAIVLLAAVVALIPPVRRAGAAGLDWVRRPSPWGRRVVTLAIGVLAALYFWFTAVNQGRDLEVLTQDERMYLVQTQQVASGHLYLPAHAHPEFFQTFYIFVKPVYAGMYFPGAAIMMTPIAWFTIPPWAWMLAIAGAVAGMTYRVVAELSDGVGGVLAAVMLVAHHDFRGLTVMAMSYLPMALLVLLTAWAFLHWRRERRLPWAAVVGAFLGWAAITRPLDAVCFGVSFGAAMLWESRGDGWRRQLMGAVVLGLCAAPFIAMQLAADRAITGRWLRTPVQLYHATYYPGVDMSGQFPRIRKGDHPLPPGTPAQMKASYEKFLLPIIRRNEATRSPVQRYSHTLQWGVCNPILSVLFFVGLLGVIGDARRAAWVGGVAIFPAAYLTFLYTRHYPTVLAPGLALVVVLGIEQIRIAFPRAAAFVGVWLTLAVLGNSAAILPEVNGVKDPAIHSPVMQAYNRAARTIDRPAVVFFTYSKRVKHLWRHEQTHNIDSARIDDAPIVRARDMGAHNIRLINYYAARQPERTFYVFNQKTRQLTRLGKAAEIKARAATGPTTRQR